MFCNKCGAPVDLTGKFCTKCGNPLENYPHEGSVIFARINQLTGVIMPVDVYMDGRLVATLNAGREVKVPMTVGKHRIAFNVWKENGEYEIETTINNPNIKVTFKLGVGLVTSKPKIVSIVNV